MCVFLMRNVGVVGAREGTLSFMCGGDRQGFEKAKEILSHMGKRVIYCGPSGSGLSAKIANKLRVFFLSRFSLCKTILKFGLLGVVSTPKQSKTASC